MAEADRGPRAGPLRRCLVTRASHRRETMLRFVLDPERRLVFDAAATLPGRGMWLSARGVVIEQALKLRVFSRAARTEIKVPPGLRQIVENALRDRFRELLGLARRSGNAVAGFEKGREWLVAGKAGLIVQAADGSAAERERFAAGAALPVAAPLSAAALGKVFGREHAVHAVIARGRLAGMLEFEAARLAGVAADAAGESIAAAAASGQ